MRILITGASGSGTSTLGRFLANQLKWPYFDTDDYYWLPTTPPFRQKRDPAIRLSLFLGDLGKAESAVVGGSMMGWGLELENSFSLISFLTVAAAIRVERLRVRELQHLGHADPQFLEWAAQYDEGRLEGRSLAKHERWLSERSCPVLRIAGDVSVEQSAQMVLNAILDALPNCTVQLTHPRAARAGECEG
jgi:hypothetical protein